MEGKEKKEEERMKDEKENSAQILKLASLSNNKANLQNKIDTWENVRKLIKERKLKINNEINVVEKEKEYQSPTPLPTDLKSKE